MSPTKSLKFTFGAHPKNLIRLRCIADKKIHFRWGAPFDHQNLHIQQCHQIDPQLQLLLQQNFSQCAFLPWRLHNHLAYFAEALTTLLRHNPRHTPQSRRGDRSPNENLSCFPSLIFAIFDVIFLVTNSCPRYSPSWLNRIPQETCMS
jgi:hypothetical protein